MRATKLYATGDIRMVDVDVPSPAKNEILIKVEAAGIFGTDRHLYHGEFSSVPDKILGHEFSDIVVDSGEADIAESVRVTCDPSTWCGACSQCQRGRVNLCPNNIATGIHRDGGFAEFCGFPASKGMVLPNEINPFTHERVAKIIADGTINISLLVSRIISLEEAALAIASPPPKVEVRAIVVPNHD